jgi:threonine dehydratase
VEGSGVLVGLDDIRTAAARIAAVVRRTPILTLPSGSGARIGLKCENLQRGGAFKLRGAYNFVSQLEAERRARGVITYSSGNHGRAVAIAARQLGITAVVVVPTDAPTVKVEAILRDGAEIYKEGTTSIERQRKAEEIAAQRDMTIVPPFDHPHIVAGQGTVGLEIIEDWPQMERVVVPVGGGGLLAGVAAAVKAALPAVEVYGVEPVGAASMRRSLDAGEPVMLDSVNSVADGLKPVRPGTLTFAHVRSLATDVVLVDDEEILRALAWCAEEARLLVEPSGAAAVAALLSRRLPEPERPTALVLSGGNVNPTNWARWVSEHGRSAADADER